MRSPISAPCGADRGTGRRLLRRISAFCFAAVVGAAPAVAQQSAPSADGVPSYSMETYRVGKDVYVRALALDERRDSLWVGTSVGALEIDLATKDVRNTFTREHGLANEYIFAIGLDPRGHVWFGTNAGGASTYLDGEWEVYFPMHGLADYWVYAFAYDDDGGAWIGTWNGANYYDPKSGEFTTYRDELVNIWVYGIAIDEEGRVWFGTEGGVSMYQDGQWKSWTEEDGLGAPNVQDLPQSPNTGLGTRSRHDLSVDVGDQQSYNPNYVFATLYDPGRKGVWFGTWGGGVSLFDGESEWTSYAQPDGLAGNVVYSIAREDDGTLWFGTNKGVSRFDGENWTTIRHGLPAPHVYSLAIGRNGTIWVGTRGGVTRLRPEQ